MGVIDDWEVFVNLWFCGVEWGKIKLKVYIYIICKYILDKR